MNYIKLSHHCRGCNVNFIYYGHIFVFMDLSELGLSQYEQQAYEALVKLDKCTASEVSRNSGVPYGKIYEVLARLENKGLTVVVPGKTKLFVPGDPNQLKEIIEKKQQKLSALSSQVEDFKKLYVEREEEPVVIARGRKVWPKVLKLHKEGTEFAYGLRSQVEIRPDTLRKLNARAKKGVVNKDLVPRKKEFVENVAKLASGNTDVRYYDGPKVSLSITEKEVMLILIESNTNVLIRDKAFIQLMKDMFEALHEKSSKVRK